MTHTPAPWRASGRYIGTANHMSYIGECRDQNGNWSDTAKSTGNAQHIVKCVNAHDDLVKALTHLIRWHDQLSVTDIAMAKEALANAGVAA